MLEKNVVEGVEINREGIREDVTARIQSPAKTEGRTFRIVLPKLHKRFAQRIQPAKGIYGGWSRAEVLDCRKRVSGIRDGLNQLGVHGIRDCGEDHPEKAEKTEGGE